MAVGGIEPPSLYNLYIYTYIYIYMCVYFIYFVIANNIIINLT